MPPERDPRRLSVDDSKVEATLKNPITNDCMAEWDWLLKDNLPAKFAISATIRNLQASKLANIFLPLRLNYIRFAFVQIRKCLEENEPEFDEDAAEIIESDWFETCNELESLLINMYVLIQEAIRRIPNGISSIMKYDGKIDVRTALKQVWSERIIYLQSVRKEYEANVLRVRQHWSEVNEIFLIWLADADEFAPQLMDIPFEYQPYWGKDTLRDDDDQGEFSAIEMPIIPALPDHEVEVWGLHKTFAKYNTGDNSDYAEGQLPST